MKHYAQSILPPPNITGELHVGHAFCFIIQDILVRYGKLFGGNKMFMGGFDHGGIATEMIMRKLYGTLDDDIKTKWETKCKNMIMKNLKNMKISCDDYYYTLDDDFSNLVLNTYHNLYVQKYISTGYKIVNWDYKLNSPLSDLEIDRIDKTGKMFYIKYKTIKNSEFILATTKPETMFGDVAIIHQDETQKDKYAINPINGKIIPLIYVKKWINKDKTGTKYLKITPSIDRTDNEINADLKLSYEDFLNENMTIKNYFDPYKISKNKPLFDLQKSTISFLQDKNILLEIKNTKQTIPISSRTNTNIIDWEKLTLELNFKDKINTVIKWVEEEQIKIEPKRYKKQLLYWLTNLKGWNIVRNITWGHRIKDKNIGNFVLDTWFSSGLCAEFFRKKTSIDQIGLLVSGKDILFFWIARMLLMSSTFNDLVPIKNLLLMPLVTDQDGQKMSKSKGNTISFNELYDQYEISHLRLLMLSLYSRDDYVKLNDEKIVKSKKLYNKIVNVKNFIDGTFDDNVDSDNSTNMMIKCLMEFENKIKYIIGNLDLSKLFPLIENYIISIISKKIIHRYRDENDINHKTLKNFYKKILFLLSPILNDL